MVGRMGLRVFGMARSSRLRGCRCSPQLFCSLAALLAIMLWAYSPPRHAPLPPSPSSLSSHQPRTLSHAGRNATRGYALIKMAGEGPGMCGFNSLGAYAITPKWVILVTAYLRVGGALW